MSSRRKSSTPHILIHGLGNHSSKSPPRHARSRITPRHDEQKPGRQQHHTLSGHRSDGGSSNRSVSTTANFSRSPSSVSNYSSYSYGNMLKSDHHSFFHAGEQGVFGKSLTPPHEQSFGRGFKVTEEMENPYGHSAYGHSFTTFSARPSPPARRPAAPGSQGTTEKIVNHQMAKILNNRWKKDDETKRSRSSNAESSPH